MSLPAKNFAVGDLSDPQVAEALRVVHAQKRHPSNHSHIHSHTNSGSPLNRSRFEVIPGGKVFPGDAIPVGGTLIGMAALNRTAQSEASAAAQTTPLSTEAAIPAGVLLLALALSFLQIADLSLTLIGISHFGPDAEGNPLLRWLMSAMGETPALLITKSLAILIIFTLASLTRRVPWIPSAMKALIVIYMLGAILPWSTILLLHLT
jgi:hypothetical protein